MVGNGKYVTCDTCGGMRMPGGVHAATHAGSPPQPWPRCVHDVAYMLDCRSNAVTPTCCRGEE